MLTAHRRALLAVACMALTVPACSSLESQTPSAAPAASSPGDPAAGPGSAHVPAPGDEPSYGYTPVAPERIATLGIAEALALPEGSPAGVRARVWGDASGYRLCGALTPSPPPRCEGDVLVITGDGSGLIDQLQVALTVDGEVAWSEQEVVVWGHRNGDDGFEPNLAAGGADASIDEASDTY